jgi:hypothetical protein
MQSFATVKGSDSIIDISDSSKLTSSVIAQIQKAYDQMQFELGVLNNTRTRYVVDRTLLLPDGTMSNVSLRVYEQSFTDAAKPTILSTWAVPTSIPSGGTTQFSIYSNVSDDSTIDYVYSYVQLPNGTTLRWSMKETAIDGTWTVIPSRSSFTDAGTYKVSIEAVDSAGNVERKDDVINFEVIAAGGSP